MWNKLPYLFLLGCLLEVYIQLLLSSHDYDPKCVIMTSNLKIITAMLGADLSLHLTKERWNKKATPTRTSLSSSYGRQTCDPDFFPRAHFFPRRHGAS